MKMPLYLGQPGPQVGWATVDAEGNVVITIFPESEQTNFGKMLFDTMHKEAIRADLF
jgi:hypothetical protein